MKTIAIIPARGGSKRFPNKNIIELDGKPLIAYSIEYAKMNYECIDEVFVTTDSPLIKEISMKFGAKVIDRPTHLSGDLEPTVTSLTHVLELLPITIENVVLLQATNPLRPKDLLTQAFQKYLEGKFESLMTVSLLEKKLGKITNNSFRPYNYTFGQRSQDMEPLYFENGLLYISKASLIENGKILGEVNCPYVINHPFTSVDIDNEDDLKLASFMLNNYLDL